MLYVQFYILHGLPGSGKSVWAEQFKIEHPDNTTILTVDGFSKLDVKLKTCFDLIQNSIENASASETMHIIIDGLFLKNAEIQQLIDTAESVVNNVCPHSYHIKSWEPDQTFCMKNILHNPTRQAARLILSNSIEQVNLDSITENYLLIYIDYEKLYVESDVAAQMNEAEERFQQKLNKLIPWYSQHSSAEILSDSYETGAIRFTPSGLYEFLLYVDKEGILGTIDFTNIFNWYVVMLSDDENVQWYVDVAGLTEYLCVRGVIHVSSSDTVGE